jgi:hypothetical protein
MRIYQICKNARNIRKWFSNLEAQFIITYTAVRFNKNAGPIVLILFSTFAMKTCENAVLALPYISVHLSECNKSKTTK